MTAIRLTGDKYKRFVETILQNYNWHSLEQLLQFEQDVRIDDIVPRDANLRVAVRQVIATAQQENWLLDFIEAVYNERSADPNMQALYAEFQPVIEAQNVDPYEVRFLRKDWAIVDRQVLRQALRRMIEHDDSRILIVDGNPVSGKTYTVQLISFLKEKLQTGKMAWIDLAELAQAARDKRVSSSDIGEAIAAQWGLGEMPRPRQEQEARWVMHFSNWLTGQLDSTGPYYWVVIDHFDKALLKQGAHDLILGLATRTYVSLPMLRLVLISYKDVTSLQSKVEGPIEYEFIPPIDEEELTNFFISEYDDREKLRQIPYSATDVGKSVAQVLRQVDPASPRRLEHLRRAVAAEVNRLA